MADDEVVVPIETEKEGECEMDDKDFIGYYTRGMLDGRDERAQRSRDFVEILRMQYAEGKDFRAANAAVMVKESGSGQSRVISTLPGPYAPIAAGTVGP